MYGNEVTALLLHGRGHGSFRQQPWYAITWQYPPPEDLPCNYRATPPDPGLPAALAGPDRPARACKRHRNVRLDEPYKAMPVSSGWAGYRARHRKKCEIGQAESWQRRNFILKCIHFFSKVVLKIENRNTPAHSRSTPAYPIPL